MYPLGCQATAASCQTPSCQTQTTNWEYKHNNIHAALCLVELMIIHVVSLKIHICIILEGKKQLDHNFQGKNYWGSFEKKCYIKDNCLAFLTKISNDLTLLSFFINTEVCLQIYLGALNASHIKNRMMSRDFDLPTSPILSI